ncbi:hypothetical protein [uncultured Caulobacter sp.]|uniref:hypothetical protein n=1 Tax=uncultured Caulobacter sp. TaxID=158749 RepID=UPI0026349987|nr:hypothetical protein [uncultured Caulobacter sp.]
MDDFVKWVAPVAGAVLGSGFTQFVTWRLSKATLQKEGQITALLLALTLEEYASRCASYVIENENLADRGADPDQAHTNMPVLSDFSEKTNWRSLGASLTEKVLQIKVHIANASNEISGDWEMGGNITAADTTGAKCLEVGVQALNTAEDLRRAFRLNAMQMTGEWSLRDYLHKGLAAQEARKAALRKRLESSPDEFGD